MGEMFLTLKMHQQAIIFIIYLLLTESSFTDVSFFTKIY